MSLLILGCNTSQERALLKLAPTLNPEMAHALAAEDTVWNCHCHDVGLTAVLEANQILKGELDISTEDSYFVSRQRLSPYLERISHCLRVEYLFEGAWTEFEAWSNRTYEQVQTLARSAPERRELLENPSVRPEEKLKCLKEIEAELRAGNSITGVVLTLEGQARLYDALNDSASALACLRRALVERERAGRHTMTMSLLIQIGYSLYKEGKVDSMLAYYSKALRMAEESRDPYTTARVLRLLGNHYQQEGQYAAGHELLRECFERSREYKGGDEVIALVQVIGEYTALGDWTLVGDLLERADYLVAEANEKADRIPSYGPARDRLVIEVDGSRARKLILTGHEAEGDSLFRSVLERSRGAPNREKFAQLICNWSSALLSRGRAQEAATLAREGLAYADSVNLPPEASRLNLILADAACHLGRSEESKAALERFRREAGNHEKEFRNAWVVHDRVRLCLALAAGDTVGAEQAAEIGMARLERIVATLDQSIEACLFLDNCRELREAIHNVLATKPKAAYGFEMAWRDLYQTLGNTSKTYFDKGSGTLSERCVELGHGIQERIAKAGAIHSVYFVSSKEVTRWTASRDGVRRELVGIVPSELESLVATATNNLAQGKSVNDPETLHALSELSALLPQEVSLAESGNSFLVSPDLYLANLPFSAINLGGKKTYRPLIASWDVAYLRRIQEHFKTNSGAGLVLANPTYPSSLSRRYPSLVPLPFGEKEAALVAAAFPGTMPLLHEAATKQSLQDHWAGSGFIYVASHFIRSVETPYLSFLPLAGPEDAPLNELLLEYSEIRKANLSGCHLVVLSGCGTGAAYANSHAIGPSLGDAFIDAGAEAVVNTRWRVRDDQSYDFARAFIAGWASGASPVAALNQIQREAWLRSSGGSSTAWTAYAVTVSEIPPASTRKYHPSRSD